MSSKEFSLNKEKQDSVKFLQECTALSMPLNKHSVVLVLTADSSPYN